ncbi:DUF2934 domain-containing protein [Rhizobium sp. B230/85]|uniref:DUF2934 domain-containing protein n=1 Tax=unclassified Rhizobium TaxID=2613769 RepID=UPI001ADBDDFF|nr:MULTISPECIES: DUF2934 domain-containing protein [unclassified Rhizobium]MBO9136533.1 DUF2934 domain-containing protein [Rhizobium sp. B209b/85]QXZ98551.1 DUF2934 domain-containing protein [Rhizobium sp. B230/85]
MSGETDRHSKAYALWEMEGRPEGRHLDHWHAAGMDETDGAADEHSVEQADTSAREDPAEGSEEIVDGELAQQGKRRKQSAG